MLGRLYEDVKDRFVTLYRQLHGNDENNFTAKMSLMEPGLTLRLTFTGVVHMHRMHFIAKVIRIAWDYVFTLP